MPAGIQTYRQRLEHDAAIALQQGVAISRTRISAQFTGCVAENRRIDLEGDEVSDLMVAGPGTNPGGSHGVTRLYVKTGNGQGFDDSPWRVWYL